MARIAFEENEDCVTAFVKKMGDKMTYRVALDDKSTDDKGAMATTWMDAAGQNGIPTAFMVNKHGLIAWIGHPMTLTEDILGQILADKFDTATFAAQYDKQEQEQEQLMEQSRKLQTAMKEKNWDAAEAAVTELEKSVGRFHIQFAGAPCKSCWAGKIITVPVNWRNPQAMQIRTTPCCKTNWRGCWSRPKAWTSMA